MMGDCAATLYITFYLRFISIDIHPIIWIGFTLNLISVVTAYWIVESPAWLVSVGEIERAKKGIQYIAKFNGVNDLNIVHLIPNPEPNDETTEEPKVTTYQPVDDGEVVEDQGLIPEKKVEKEEVTFCSNKTLLVNLILMTAMWTASSFDYYLITFFLKYIPGNIFVNTSISSLSEIAAYIFSGFFMKLMGLKISYIVAWVIGATGGLLMTIFSHDDSLMGVFVLLSKFGVSFAFNNSYLGTPRMFPVSLCGTAFGLCNVVARFSTVLSPIVAEFTYPVPMLIFSVLCIAAGVLTLFLRVLPLPQKDDVDSEK